MHKGAGIKGQEVVERKTRGQVAVIKIDVSVLKVQGAETGLRDVVGSSSNETWCEY